jgi:formylglycine-generating enzyme required for sulfatase activity
VNRADAIAFCEWLTRSEQSGGLIKPDQSYRLPTNEEWDLAVGLSNNPATAGSIEARIKEGNTFPWGSSWPPPARSANLSDADIEGFEDGFEFTSPVGSFPPNVGGLHDMGGNVWEWVSDASPENGFVRGGSWMYFQRDTLLSAYRYEVPKNLRASTFGFRLVRATDNASAVAQNPVTPMPPNPLNPGNPAPELTPDEVAAARLRLLGEGETPDAKASAGQPYHNGFLMEFRPLPKHPWILVATIETRVSDFQAYAKESSITPKPPGFAQEPDHPVVEVTAGEAEAFCEWLTTRERTEKRIKDAERYRLPTDGEWDELVGLPETPSSSPAEKAVTVDPNVFPWGGTWPPPLLSGNLGPVEGLEPDRHPYTAPVASYRAGPNGLHDICGNVSEWTSSSWKEGSPERAIRGSSWSSVRRESNLSGYRDHLDAGQHRNDVGFRMVLELAPPEEPTAPPAP